METRLLIAYALMVLMALAGAAIGYWLWHNSHGRAAPRQRLRDQLERDQRKLAQEAAQADRRSTP